MSAHGRPPGGTAGAPGSGDDDYGSVVFDESFVRAARIREYSAEERIDDAGRSVTLRPPWAPLARHRSTLGLLVLMAVAFGAAVFLGIRHPYRAPVAAPGGPLSVRLVALTPTGPVPAAADDPLYARSGAASWPVDAAGLGLPRAHPAGRYTVHQVRRALDITRSYLTASALDEDELSTGDLPTLQGLIADGQRAQFKRSLSTPADDGRHAATGWAVRFDTPRVALADRHVRVRGRVSYGTVDGGLSVRTDHTMIYTVRPVGDITRAPSLFTVRRELRLYFTPSDLATGHAEILRAAVQAGPVACGRQIAASFRPLFTGQSAPTDGTDPYSRATPDTTDCHPMAALPQPLPPTPRPGQHGATHLPQPVPED